MKTQTKAYILTAVLIGIINIVYAYFFYRGFSIWVTGISGLIAIIAYPIIFKLLSKNDSKKRKDGGSINGQ